MKKIISNLKGEILSRESMRSITGGIAVPDVRVVCDCCIDSDCNKLPEATCPKDTAEECNGLPCGYGGVLENCVNA